MSTATRFKRRLAVLERLLPEPKSPPMDPATAAALYAAMLAEPLKPSGGPNSILPTDTPAEAAWKYETLLRQWRPRR